MDFYVYLPSNTDFLPENKSNNYVTKLAREISLEGEWECSLKEIHYPRTWASLFFHECSFVVEKEEWRNVWENRRIEAGHYLTKQDLINAINNAVQRDDVLFNYSEQPSVHTWKYQLGVDCTLQSHYHQCSALDMEIRYAPASLKVESFP